MRNLTILEATAERSSVKSGVLKSMIKLLKVAGNIPKLLLNFIIATFQEFQTILVEKQANYHFIKEVRICEI